MAFTSFLIFYDVVDSGTSLSWGSWGAYDFGASNTTLNNNAPTGTLDVGSDSFYWETGSNPTLNFSGYYVSSGADDFGIFTGVNPYDGGQQIGIAPYDKTLYDELWNSIDVSGNTTSQYSAAFSGANCFLEGTCIATPDGEVPIEDLRIGQYVTTGDGRAVRIRWVARQTYRKFANFSLPAKHAPVCISAGALGNGLPRNDLYVTADHGMIIDGLIINAGALVNGASIRFVTMSEMPRSFTYYHIETEAHDVILAEGARSETFIDYVGRKGFDNYDEYLALYGCDRIIPEMMSVRVSAQRQLPDAIADRMGIRPYALQLKDGLSALEKRLRA